MVNPAGIKRNNRDSEGCVVIVKGHVLSQEYLWIFVYHLNISFMVFFFWYLIEKRRGGFCSRGFKSPISLLLAPCSACHVLPSHD